MSFVLNQYAGVFHVRNRRQATHPVRAGILCLAALCLLGPAVLPSAAAVVHGTVHRVAAEAAGAAREPLPGTLITDGYGFAETDGRGRFELPLHEAARWVAMINPRGTMPTTHLHHMLPEDRGNLPDMAFELRPLPRSPDEPFYFTHQSDLHLARDYHADLLGSSIGRHIGRIPEAPLFVLDSGDVSNDSIERMEWARELFDHYPVPVFTCKGNHDRDRAGREAYRGETMERLFVPAYYAFTAGNYLFLNYPWLVSGGPAIEWTEALLERLDGEFHVVANLHHWDGLRARAPVLLDLLKQHGGKGVFWGHYHTTQVLTVEGIPTFGINAGRSHIRDLGRPSFSLIRAEPDGRLSADHRKAGFFRHLDLIHPARELALEANWSRGLKRGSTLPLLVNAADTALKLQSVSVTVTEPGGSPVLARVDLENGGGWSWTGKLDVPLDWHDPVLFFVEAVDQTGTAWPVLERKIWVADPAPTPRVAIGADWGMYQGGPGRTGAAASELSPPLQLAWVHADRNFGFSAPVVAGGRLFAGLMNNAEPLAPYPVVVALDAVTGERLWEHKLAGGRSPRNTLATDGKRVVYQACDGFVVALDATTGEPVWTLNVMVSQLSGAQIFLRGSPLLFDGTVFAGVRSFAGAFGLADGDLHWAQVPDRGSRSWANPSMALGDGRLFLPQGGTLRARDAADGSERWSARIQGNLTPVFDGNRVYVCGREGEHGSLLALHAETGEPEWETVLALPPGFSAPAVGGDRVFLSLAYSVVAFNAGTGDPLWDTETGSILVSLVVAGRYLYAVTEGGRLLALSAETGEPVWEFNLGTKVTSGMAISGNALFVTGRNGVLYAFVSTEHQ